MNLPPQPYHTPANRRTTTPRNSPAPLRATYPPRVRAPKPPHYPPDAYRDQHSIPPHPHPSLSRLPCPVHRPATAPTRPHPKHRPIRWNSQKNQHAIAPTPDGRRHPCTICNRATNIPHWTYPHSSVASAHTNPCTRITNPATCHTHKPVGLYAH